MDAIEYTEYKVTLGHSGRGVGLRLRETLTAPVNRPTVIALVPGKPAQACGKIAPGDVLISVDGVDMRGIAFERVMASLRGAAPPEIALTLMRPKGKEVEQALSGRDIGGLLKA